MSKLIQDFQKAIDSFEWKEAKRYINRHPHSYVWCDDPNNLDLCFIKNCIWRHGVEHKWFQQTYIYYLHGEEIFWTITSPLVKPFNDAMSYVKLVNRASIWNRSGWLYSKTSRLNQYWTLPEGHIAEAYIKAKILSSKKFVNSRQVILKGEYYFFIQNDAVKSVQKSLLEILGNANHNSSS